MAGGALTRTAVIQVVGKADTSALGKAGAEAETVGAKFKKAFHGIGSALSAAGFTSPFTELIEQSQQFFDGLEEGKKHVGETLMGVGAAAAGLGALLQHASDTDKIAQQNLQTAIAATGKGYSGLNDQIDKAEKTSERYGNTTHVTDDALTSLTQRLGDPKKALADLDVAFDVAADKHISLSAAADLVGRAAQGNAKVLKEFGIVVDATASKTIDLTKLTSAHQSAVTALTVAEESARVTEDTVAAARAKGGETATQAAKDTLDLQKAHDALAAAQARVSTSTNALAAAQAHNAAATTAGSNAVALLATKVHGDAANAADTFTGHMKALGAVVEDDTAKWGGMIAGPLMKAGPVMAGLGGIIESGLIPKMGKGIASLLGFGQAASASGDEAAAGAATAEAAVGTEAAAVEAAAVTIDTAATGIVASEEGIGVGAETAGAAVDIGFAPILLIVAAVGIAAYELYEHWGTVTHAIGAAADWVGDEIEGAFGEVEHFLEKWGVDILAVVAPFIGIPLLIYQHWGQIEHFFSGIWTEVTKDFDEGVSYVEGIPDRIWHALTGMAGKMETAAKDAFLAFVAAEVTGITNLVDEVEKVPGDIENALEDAGTWLLQTGEDIVSGLISGIGNMGSDLISFIGKFAKNSIEDPIKSFFGISSPSKLMMEHGKNIASGLAIGIASGAGAVHEASGSLTAAHMAALTGIGGALPAPGGISGRVMGGDGASSSPAALIGELHVHLPGLVDPGSADRVAAAIARPLRDELLRLKPQLGTLGLA